MNKSQTDAKIRQIIRGTGIPLTQFSNVIGWKTAQTLDWWSEREGTLQEKNIESLAGYLGVSMESLFDQNLDLSLIRKRVIDGPQILPEAYSANASSYVRTLAHIIEYLSMLHGRHFTDNILRALNIHPLFFNNLENKINLKFYRDMFKELKARGAKEREIASLACYIFLSLKDTDLGRKFKAAKNHCESYEILASNATLFETNFEYNFEIEKDKIRITAKPSDATKDLLKNSPEEYKHLFAYRKNVFSWFPTLSDLTPLPMTTTKCLLRGDSCTVYEAEPPARPEDIMRQSHLNIVP